MATESPARALRCSAALSELAHVSCLRLSGPGAFDAAERLCPTEIFLHDCQMLHTLLLDESARIVADAYLCRDGDALLLLAEAAEDIPLAQHVRDSLPPGAPVAVDDLSAEHEILSVNGPYAWEVLSRALSPELVSLPYMSFYKLPGYTCFRAGKTGEFGYDLLIPAADASRVGARLLEVGAAFDMARADLEDLDQCALENFYFNIRREGRAGVTPIELQLQWRVSYAKEFVGSAALRALRQTGPRTRLTCLLADAPIHAGDELRCEGRAVGAIVNAGRSAVRGDFVGLALIEIGLAYPGLSSFSVANEDGTISVRTVSPPVIDNRSIYVSPQRHSYAAREACDFPPLC